MPRTSKCRRVCALPPNAVFTPQQTPCAFVVLTVEQVEALRLCDLEGFDQDKAAEQMMISRGTLQRILYGARRQMADALVHGKGIRIEGGHYSCTIRAVPARPPASIAGSAYQRKSRKRGIPT